MKDFFSFLKKNQKENETPQEENISKDKGIYSPMNGTLVDITEVPDEVFASKALGEGIGIIPTDGNVFAPFDGTVTAMMDTKHAIGLMGDNKVEILIHVGIDTVSLNGEPFDYVVKDGAKVKQGDLLLVANLDRIKVEGYNIHTPIVITNTDEFESITVLKQGEVAVGEKIIDIN